MHKLSALLLQNINSIIDTVEGGYNPGISSVTMSELKSIAKNIENGNSEKMINITYRDPEGESVNRDIPYKIADNIIAELSRKGCTVSVNGVVNG